MQGCDAVNAYVFYDFPYYNDSGNPGKYPIHPTKARIPDKYRLQRYDDNIAGWTTMTYMPFDWWDCSTWGYIVETKIAVGAYSSGGGTPEPEWSKPITVLRVKGDIK